MKRSAFLGVAYAWNNPNGLWEDIGFEARMLEKCENVDSTIGHYIQSMKDADSYEGGIERVVSELRGRLDSCIWHEDSPNFFYGCREDELFPLATNMQYI